MGLSRAGFDVVGVDIEPQPRYPFTFIQGDALRPPLRLERFDFIWASPPCQFRSIATISRGNPDDHPNLIPETRSLLTASGKAFAIENVMRAPIRRDLILTGEMFGLNTYRKRAFELSFFVLAPPPGRPFGPVSRPGSVTVTGHSGGSYGRDSKRHGREISNGDGAAWAKALGVDWMINTEMAEAIPPAYAEYIGRAALKHIESRS